MCAKEAQKNGSWIPRVSGRKMSDGIYTRPSQELLSPSSFHATITKPLPSSSPSEFYGRGIKEEKRREEEVEEKEKERSTVPHLTTREDRIYFRGGGNGWRRGDLCPGADTSHLLSEA